MLDLLNSNQINNVSINPLLGHEEAGEHLLLKGQLGQCFSGEERCEVLSLLGLWHECNVCVIVCASETVSSSWTCLVSFAFQFLRILGLLTWVLFRRSGWYAHLYWLCFLGMAEWIAGVQIRHVGQLKHVKSLCNSARVVDRTNFLHVFVVF